MILNEGGSLVLPYNILAAPPDDQTYRTSRSKLGFSLLRSAIMCIRGARSSFRCPVAEAPIAVQVAEAHI